MRWDNKDVKCKKAPIRRLVLFHIALFFYAERGGGKITL